MPSSVLSLRLSAKERALLEAASALTGISIGDFVRREALEAAEIVVAAGPMVTIAAKDCEKFEAWAASPAREIAGIRELVGRPPTWRK
jgi:uncharacterized protein (DUF1778 family)